MQTKYMIKLLDIFKGMLDPYYFTKISFTTLCRHNGPNTSYVYAIFTSINKKYPMKTVIYVKLENWLFQKVFF